MSENRLLQPGYYRFLISTSKEVGAAVDIYLYFRGSIKIQSTIMVFTFLSGVQPDPL